MDATMVDTRIRASTVAWTPIHVGLSNFSLGEFQGHVERKPAEKTHRFTSLLHTVYIYRVS